MSRFIGLFCPPCALLSDVGELIGSDSDSDDNDDEDDVSRTGRVMSPETPPIHHDMSQMSSLEASMISVDIASSSVMTKSVTEAKVRQRAVLCDFCPL